MTSGLVPASLPLLFFQVQEVVELMEKKPGLQEVSALPLVQREEPSPLVEAEEPKELHKPTKKLKVSTSDVSVGSQGLPKMFGPEPSPAASPASNKPLPKGEPHENPLPKREPSEPNSLPKGKKNTLAKPIAEPSFLRRRLGQQATKTSQTKEQKANLRKDVGFVAAMKRHAKKRQRQKAKPRARSPCRKRSPAQQHTLEKKGPSQGDQKQQGAT